MGLSWQHLLILLVIVLLIFGTKRLTSAGSDIGKAIRGFKKAMNEDAPKLEADPEAKPDAVDPAKSKDRAG